MTQDISQDPTVRPRPVSSAAHAASTMVFPEFCTMCGQEILCDVCGKPNARGVWLEVNDKVDGTSSAIIHAVTGDDNETEYNAFDDIEIDFYDEAMLSDPPSDDDFGEYFITSDAINGPEHDTPVITDITNDQNLPLRQQSPG
jgi:hypothetical protein